MLVVGRAEGESIVIGDEIVVTVVKLKDGYVKIGIDAPGYMKILRHELYAKAKQSMPWRLWVNEVDDSLSMEDVIVFAPCQPIGCDNGHHLPNCYYASSDAEADAVKDEETRGARAFEEMQQDADWVRYSEEQDDKNTRPGGADQ